jgi:hypothetical protein
MIKKTRVAVTTTGSDGSATGTGTTEDVIKGRIVRVDVNYHASAPGTTDLTLTQTNEDQAVSIVSLTDQKTDKVLYPTVQLTDNGGTGRTLDGTRPLVDYYPVADTLTVSLAGCNALTDAVVLEIYYEVD